jgi:hypothetical protein
MSASLENAQPAHSHAHAKTLPPAEIFDYKHVGGKFILLGLVGGLALLASFIWGFFQPRQFAYSYLLGFYFFFTICLGGFFWTLVHHGVDAEWSVTADGKSREPADLRGDLVHSVHLREGFPLDLDDA